MRVQKRRKRLLTDVQMLCRPMGRPRELEAASSDDFVADASDGVIVSLGPSDRPSGLGSLPDGRLLVAAKTAVQELASRRGATHQPIDSNGPYDRY